LFNGLSASAIGESRFVLNTNEQFLAGGQIQTNTSVFDAIGQGLPAPPPETIEEIHVNTSMYDVSQGANSGAHIAVATKSGTNDLHGSVYEYHQTSGWDANQFFLNAAGIARPPLHRNTFGATLGGPIKQNKLFFFGSYQGQRVTDATNGSTQFANVPTGLSDDRSAATLAALAGVPVAKVDSVALAILNAKGTNGKFMVPSATVADPNMINSLGGNAQESGPPIYDVVGSVKGHLDCTSCEGPFFSSLDGIFSLSFFLTKARSLNLSVESGSTNHLFGLLLPTMILSSDAAIARGSKAPNQPNDGLASTRVGPGLPCLRTSCA